MMREQRSWIGALAILAVAPPVAAGHPVPPQDRAPSAQEDASLQPSPAAFVEVDRLVGLAVVGPEDQLLGTIEDLVLDWGAKRVGFVLLAAAGPGGDAGEPRALPYEELRWVPAEGRFRCRLSPEDLEVAGPELLGAPAAPSSGPGTNGEAPAPPREGGGADAPLPADRDAYTRFFEGAAVETVRCVLLAVETRPSAEQAEGAPAYVQAAVLQAGDEETTRALLGPSSFVMAEEHRPRSGESIVLLGVPGQDAVGPLFVAQSYEQDGREVRLRDDRGRPLWQRLRHLRGSVLKRQQVGGPAEAWGPVKGLYVELERGLAVFAAFAHQGRLLPLPLEALSAGAAGHLVLDGFEPAHLKDAPVLLDEDGEELADPAFRYGVYRHYGLTPRPLGRSRS